MCLVLGFVYLVFEYYFRIGPILSSIGHVVFSCFALGGILV